MENESKEAATAILGGGFDLRRLIVHRESVQATDSLEQVYKAFREHGAEFVAILDGTHYSGMVSWGHMNSKLRDQKSKNQGQTKYLQILSEIAPAVSFKGIEGPDGPVTGEETP